MQIDFTSPITDLKGNTIKEGEDEVTLAAVVTTAMIAPLPKDQDTSGPEKVRMFRIAQKATDGGVQELTVEDVALIKSRVAKIYGALVVGRVYDLLEGTKPSA